jgi:hypothetical protein
MEAGSAVSSAASTDAAESAALPPISANPSCIATGPSLPSGTGAGEAAAIGEDDDADDDDGFAIRKCGCEQLQQFAAFVTACTAST